MMSIGNLPDPVLVTRPGPLRQLAEKLNHAEIVAVDTESNSLYAYREQVCLIQFTVDETDYLVDPLALKDLSPLAPVFANPGIEKIFHAAEYDIICLKRDFDFEFANIFDTMLAARILGREAFGLGSVLEAEFGVQLDKRFQRANWGQRPLPHNLLSYARLDTHFLIPLRHRLKDALVENNLWMLAREDFRRMTEVSSNGRVHEDKTPDCWKVSGAFDLTPQQAAVLFELCQYRDRVARTINRPLFKVINDRTLVAISAAAPKTLAELSHLPGMTHGQVERHGQHLLAAVQRGLEAEPLHPPRPPRPKEDYLDRVERLRRWRKTTAEELGVSSDVVLPRDLLFSLAENNPRRQEELASLLSDVPWRLERFGGQILKILSRR